MGFTAVRLSTRGCFSGRGTRARRERWTARRGTRAMVKSTREVDVELALGRARREGEGARATSDARGATTTTTTSTSTSTSTTTTTTTRTRAADENRRSVAERFCDAQLGVWYDKRREPWHAHGEVMMIALGQLFEVAAYATTRTANVSLCGYVEVVPNYVAMMYFMSVAGALDACAWSSAMATRGETRGWARCARALAGVVPTAALAGTFAFPRCMFGVHQRCVVWWAWSALGAMALEWALDSKCVRSATRRSERVVTSDVALPQLTYALGFYITMKYYYTNSTEFFRGEVLAATSFGWWCMSKHRAGTFAHQPAARAWTWREFVLIDGILAVALLSVYRYNEYHNCPAFGRF